MARRNQGPKLRWIAVRAAYYITWTVNGRSRKRSTGTADRDQAEAIFAEWLHLRGRKAGPSDPATILVTDVLGEYAAERGSKVAAPRIIGCAVDALTGYWQGLTVADVTPHSCERYGDWRARSKNTIRRTLPEKPESRARWLVRREAARLLRASRTRKGRLYMPLFILLALYTGRRKEAILSLRWPQVDLEAKRIDFEQPGRRTKKRKGLIPIPARLLPHLIRARRRGSDLGYVLHINGVRIGDIKKGFEAACERADLQSVTPHTLRHTAATWLMQKGVELWEAAGFLAMSEKTLRDVYGHHHPDYMIKAAEAIGRRVSRMGA